MFRPSPELIILVFGLLSVLAALQHVSDVKAKAALVKALFGVGLLTQLLSHLFQYSYAVTNRLEAQKKVEAATAIALYAYTQNNISLLKATSADSYLVGYRIFKNDQLEEAVPYFHQAIFEQKFTASSYYMLAHISSHDKTAKLDKSKDWTVAYDLLEKAIADNPDYAPAYYLRAKLDANTNKIDAAIRSLRKAVLPVKSGTTACFNINDRQQIEREWAPLKDNVDFAKLQKQCAAIHGLSTLTPPASVKLMDGVTAH